MGGSSWSPGVVGDFVGMTSVHRLWLKGEDTFSSSSTALTPHEVWFHRGASSLPTDSQGGRFRHTRVPTQLDDALQPSALANSRGTCVPSLSRFVIASMFRSSVSVHSVARCTLLASLSLLSLFFRHRPLIVPSAKLVYRCTRFGSVVHLSQPTQPFPTKCLRSFCFTHLGAGLIHNMTSISF